MNHKYAPMEYNTKGGSDLFKEPNKRNKNIAPHCYDSYANLTSYTSKRLAETKVGERY